MLVDLHAKSSLSEGVNIDLDEVFAQANDVGLDALAFCERLSTNQARRTLEAANRAGIPAFIGVEIPTDRGILLAFAPEVDDFYFIEEWRQLTEYATPPAHQVIQLFDERGGAVIASRPYDLSIPYNMGDLIFTLDNLHGVEVYNTRVGQIQCDFALEAAQYMGVPTCGGTDPVNADSFGQYATFFDHDVETQRQFVNALRDSAFWAVRIGTDGVRKTSRKTSSRGRNGRKGGRKGGRGGGRRGGGGRGRKRS